MPTHAGGKAAPAKVELRPFPPCFNIPCHPQAPVPLKASMPFLGSLDVPALYFKLEACIQVAGHLSCLMQHNASFNASLFSNHTQRRNVDGTEAWQTQSSAGECKRKQPRQPTSEKMRCSMHVYGLTRRSSYLNYNRAQIKCFGAEQHRQARMRHACVSVQLATLLSEDTSLRPSI